MNTTILRNNSYNLTTDGYILRLTHIDDVIVSHDANYNITVTISKSFYDNMGEELHHLIDELMALIGYPITVEPRLMGSSEFYVTGIEFSGSVLIISLHGIIANPPL